MIVEEDSGLPPRYRANTPEFFIKARYELPPGTILYADIAAFLAFIAWTPEAKQNHVDPAWNGPFPGLEPGVYILEARSVSSGLSPAPVSLLPGATGVAPDSLASDSGVGDISLSAQHCCAAHANSATTPRMRDAPPDCTNHGAGWRRNRTILQSPNARSSCNVPVLGREEIHQKDLQDSRAALGKAHQTDRNGPLYAHKEPRMASWGPQLC